MNDFLKRHLPLIFLGVFFFCISIAVMLGPKPPPEKPQVVQLTDADRKFIADAITSAAAKGRCP